MPKIKSYLVTLTAILTSGILLLGFQNCSSPTSALATTSVSSLPKHQLSLSSLSAVRPVAVLMNGSGLCNSDNFVPVPGNPGLFLGRRMLNTSADPCSGNAWTISFFQLNEAGDTFNWQKDLFMPPFAPANKSFTVTTAYDPTIAAYNGEMFVAFECAGSGTGTSASSCVAPFTVAQGADTSRVTIPVKGAVVGGDIYSASTPKLLSFQNNLYMYWTAVHMSASGDWINLTTRGTQLTQQAAGKKGLWSLRSVGKPVPSKDPLNIEVYGLDSNDPTASNLADTFQVFSQDGMIYVVAGLGGAGCLNPLSPVAGCYHLQVSASLTPLGLDAFNAHPMVGSGLPYNPQEYSHILSDDAGGFYILGNFLNANLNGAVSPSPIIASGFQRFPIDLASLSFAGLPNFSNQQKFINSLYLGLLGRASDLGGLQAWSAAARSGSLSCSGLAVGFLNSLEYSNREQGLNDDDYVRSLYNGLLNRTPAEVEVRGWANLISSGAASRQDVANGFLQSSEFNSDCSAQYGFSNGAGAFSNLSIPQ